MEFEKFLNFLHKVSEKLYEMQHQHPEWKQEVLLKNLSPDSNYFKEHFSKEFNALSPEYQNQYKTAIEQAPFYKIEGKNLLQSEGVANGMRRIFERLAKLEFYDLQKQGYEFEKIPFQEFIEQINQTPKHRFNGFEFEDFDYEKLRQISPTDISDAIQLRKKWLDKNDEKNNKRLELMDHEFKKAYPEMYQRYKDQDPAYDNVKNILSRDQLSKIWHEASTEYQHETDKVKMREKLEKFSNLEMKVYDLSEYKKVEEEYKLLENEFDKKVPKALQFWIKDVDIMNNMNNGIDFKEFRYQPDGSIKRYIYECECDIDIQPPVAFLRGVRGQQRFDYAETNGKPDMPILSKLPQLKQNGITG